jgi:hypothetical protein
MKTLEILRSIQLALCLLFFTAVTPISAAELSTELLKSWAETWYRVIDNAMGGSLERAANGSLSTLDEGPQTQALEELAQLLYPSVPGGH